jgi:FAD synthase
MFLKSIFWDDEYWNKPNYRRSKNQKIEVNILEFDNDIYNKPITIHFLKRIREEKKFDTLNDLKIN